MQKTGFFTQKKAAAALCIVLLMVAQQVCAGPLVSQDQSSFLQSADLRGSDVVHAPRRIARMTPLWRIMNSKPFGAYCQNNYECSTGLCRAGHCSTMNRSASQPVNY
ncbi:liver-expressed antimicrobial peptide 2 [Pundamilia nyererei]|uniref:Liver enriched antimicrobial peptide 2 n=2 Tax=Haplochromini TaxID=319058 RepID=A0A3B4GL80_9CICH|nr:PREDICTED: liver-expressed antimicrobial peptide 2 [Pundamilia nyererei]XP_005951092.1 liver-expressed antimicrobial peptide 2 [Haplochromis burtoni]XP_039886091.1 liver-expressed antimicrobial peptide 2 [Simochromis diagramma]